MKYSSYFLFIDYSRKCFGIMSVTVEWTVKLWGATCPAPWNIISKVSNAFSCVTKLVLTCQRHACVNVVLNYTLASSSIIIEGGYAGGSQ